MGVRGNETTKEGVNGWKKVGKHCSRALWSNMNLITNYKGPSKSADPDDVTLPDRPNEFYARFDRDN